MAFINIICLDLFLIAHISRMKSLGEEWFMTNKIFVLWWNMTDSSVFWFTSQFVLCFAGCFKYFFRSICQLYKYPQIVLPVLHMCLCEILESTTVSKGPISVLVKWIHFTILSLKFGSTVYTFSRDCF